MINRRRYTSDELLNELQRALGNHSEGPASDFARLDYGRAARLGTPEIILAENKTDEQVIVLISRMLERSNSVLVSRTSDTQRERIAREFGDLEIENPPGSQMVRIARSRPDAPGLAGRIAIFTAGTSDLPRAEEVRLVAEEMGSSVRIWADIGVAGLHRLIHPFREAIDSDVSVIVVVAGMDGALPSVISGLSPVPVIGLPTSVGYGFGGQGEGALMAMLQTCAPGLTVVNIDNSVGAGVAAARIANQSSDLHQTSEE